MDTNTREIKIAGAGISGLTAGINLAKAGYKVTIFECGSTSGTRFEGDFQGIENWSSHEDILDFLRRINIDVNFPITPLKEIVVLTNRKEHKRVTGERAGFYLVKRGQEEDTIDSGLRRQAADLENLEIKFNCPIQDYNGIDIVATGPYLSDHYTDAVVSGYKFVSQHEDIVALILDDSLAPDGYGYCIIHNHVGVCTTVIFRDFTNLLVYREKTLAKVKEYLGEDIQPLDDYAGIGNFFLGKIPAGKKIFVGEAGGFQDALWGFGMKYAAWTGHLAARSIIDGTDYYATIAKLILPPLKASIANRFIYSHLNNRTYNFLVDHLAFIPSPVELIGRNYSYTKLRKLIFPLANFWWRRHSRDPRPNIK